MLRTDMMPVDVEGYLLPWTADDETIECGFDDPAYGPPESWPATTDAYTWELGPQADVTLEPFAPSLEDELDYREWAEEVDRRWADGRLERGYPAEYPPSYVTDADVALVTGCVG